KIDRGMKNNRRNFLKLSGLTGLGVAGAGALKGFANEPANNVAVKQFDRKPTMQRFNMCDYAAPTLDTVRVGLIGLGDRGPDHLSGLIKIEGVQIKALCDVRPEAANRAKKSIDGYGHNPVIYSENAESWKKLCERD